MAGCSRQPWRSFPWGESENTESDGGKRKSMAGAVLDGQRLFPPSDAIMRGLSCGISYPILEVFDQFELRLLRLRDPWAGTEKNGCG
ncbi:unnamed protein product [Choristocarpus tenellus]